LLRKTNISIDYASKNGDYTCMSYWYKDEKGAIILDRIERKEVRKKMAIDYKKEWKKLHKGCGHLTILQKGNIPLKYVMDSMIVDTISKREKLMETYLKGTMTTDICKTKHKSFDVRIFLHGVPVGTITVGRTNFEKWIEEKGGKVNAKYKKYRNI